MSTQKGMFLVKFAGVTLALALILSMAAPALAQADRPAPRGSIPAASGPQGPTDPAELETFMDSLLAQEMEENHIAGAAVSVVKDGKLLFAKGYGYSDLENRVPVDPGQTVFRIGSTTKLIVWTAVMQLVEQGKLDLNKDINEYLDFHIPDTYPQPITLKHLMTHTAGFEDLYLDFVSYKNDDTLAGGAFLASHIPARVFPPGEVASYSNYGAALAGYIVARVAGESYDQYIQKNILDPLGMAHSSALAMLHPNVMAQVSVGYVYQDGAFQIFPKFYGPSDLAPIGFMVASATDMARFMIAHLENGLYSDAAIPEVRILEEATARQMHTTLYTPDPRLLGTDYGFFDFTDNGQRTIGHSGTAEPMHSLLLILPDQNVGVFVAYNTLNAEPLTIQHLGFQRAFFDHYYPATAVEPVQSPADFSKQAGRFVGTYRLTRSAYTTIEKFRGAMGMNVITITDSGNGTIAMNSPWGVWKFAEVGPLFFRQVDAPFHILFREDDRGRITDLFTDYTPQFGFEKLSWYETPGFSTALLMGCVLVFVSMLVVASIRSIRNRRLGGGKRDPKGARTALWIILGICILNLLFVVGSLLWNNPYPSFGIPLNFKIVLGLGVLSALLTAGALVYNVLAWKDSYWGAAFRGYYTVVTFAAVAFVWFLNFWNLLGWRF